MKTQRCCLKSWGIAWILIALIGMISPANALEGLSLLKAGFLLTNPEESDEDPDEFLTVATRKSLGKTPLFFWTKIACETASCQERLQRGAIKLSHRWVWLYGISKRKTQKLETFTPQQIVDNAAWSECVIDYSGRWFVEISTSDGEKLCIGKTCQFPLGVK